LDSRAGLARAGPRRAGTGPTGEAARRHTRGGRSAPGAQRGVDARPASAATPAGRTPDAGAAGPSRQQGAAHRPCARADRPTRDVSGGGRGRLHLSAPEAGTGAAGPDELSQCWKVPWMMARPSVLKARLKETTAGEASGVTPRESSPTACTTK